MKALLLGTLLVSPLFFLAAGSTPHGQDDQEPKRPAPLLPEEADDFDFWVGKWQCRNTEGKLAGTNEITKECGGRVLQEHWTGAGGSVGTSLNMFDPLSERWHQTWVDQQGTLLLLDGGLDEEGRMLLEGTRPLRDGNGKALHRILWTPEEDTVRQTWTYSIDDGVTWNTIADLIYSRE